MHADIRNDHTFMKDSNQIKSKIASYSLSRAPAKQTIEGGAENCNTSRLIISKRNSVHVEKNKTDELQCEHQLSVNVERRTLHHCFYVELSTIAHHT